MSSTIRRAHEKCFEKLEDYFGLHYKHMRDEESYLNLSFHNTFLLTFCADILSIET